MGFLANFISVVKAFRNKSILLFLSLQKVIQRKSKVILFFYVRLGEKAQSKRRNLSSTILVTINKYVNEIQLLIFKKET